MSDVPTPEAEDEAVDDETGEAGAGIEPEDDSAGYDRLPVWSSDSELDLEHARRLTSHRGATLVMLLGESGVGKTTLLAELWTDLILHGSLGRVQFGGSCTAIPFEERAFKSRMESGVLKAYTLKTYEEDDGFLHLRAGIDETTVELLLSDFAGEHFVRVREGNPIQDELTWTARVDRFAVVFDAEAAVTPGEREVAITRTERLLNALTVSPAINSMSRLAIVVAKDDAAASEEDRARLDASVARLLTIAQRVDPTAEVIHVAARPELGTVPYGLAPLLEWMASGASNPPSRQVPLAAPMRAFGRFRA